MASPATCRTSGLSGRAFLTQLRPGLQPTGGQHQRCSPGPGALRVMAGVVLLILIQHVHAYPNGAGLKACDKGSPQVCHDAAPQTSPAPFEVMVQVDRYSPGVLVNVTIQITNSTVPLKGFLMGAHKVNGSGSEYYGSFGATPEYHPRCGINGNTGATHTNNDEKQNLTLQWIPPEFDEGDLFFKSAIVNKYDVYWVNITSKLTLKAFGYPTNETTSTIAQPSTPVPMSSFTKDLECGHTKSCYGVCKDGGGGCTFLTTWYKANQWLVITIKSIVPSGKDNYWAAIGFGIRASMNVASVTDCVAYGGHIQAFLSVNREYENTRVQPDPKIGLDNATGSLVEGILSCTVSRQLVIGGGQDVFNLTSQKYHILLARGEASGWTKLPHTAFDDYVTAGSYDVSQVIDIGAKQPQYPLVRLHGCLMTFAWLLCASVGVIVSRFYKATWPMQKIGGVKIWFTVHRSLMAVACVFTVAGFVIIFTHVLGYSKISGPEYQQIHPILGIIVTTLTVINPAMALFRCDPGHKDRAVFNWAHWFVGTSAFILGVVTVAIGTTLPVLQLPPFVTYIVIGFGAWHVFVHLLLEIDSWLERNNSMVGAYRDLQSFSESFDGLKYQYHRYILLALHIMVSLGVSIAVIDELIDL